MCRELSASRCGGCERQSRGLCRQCWGMACCRRAPEQAVRLIPALRVHSSVQQSCRELQLPSHRAGTGLAFALMNPSLELLFL